MKTAMTRISRRHLLAAAGAASLAAARPSGAIEPWKRGPAFFSGLSLTTYSLRPLMRWWCGKQTAGRLEMLDFLDYCAELGLEAAELTSYFFAEPVERSEINRLKRRAHLLGIDISAGAVGNNFGHPPDSDTTRREMESFRTWIDHFADLGAPAVRVFASKSPPAGVPDDQVEAHVIANLQTALSHAEKRGVLLGLENHDFVKNIDRLLRILRAIDSEWLGVTWDSSNLEKVPDPYAELARIAPYAITAQIKVMTRVNGVPQPADYGRLVQILRDAAYRGYVVLEYEEAEDPLQAIPRHIGRLRELIGCR